MEPRSSKPRRAAPGRRASPSPPDHAFNLVAVAARSAEETGHRRAWPGDEAEFIAEILRRQGVPEALIARLAAAAAAAPGTPLVDRLAGAIAATLAFLPLDETLRRPALLLVGPPGAGKTTTGAKLAVRLGERRVLVISTDGDRIGGVAQLEEYARVLGLPLAVAHGTDDLAALAQGAAGRTLLVDTGGLGPEDEAATRHLARLIAAGAAEPLLVLPADSAAAEAEAAARHAASLGARQMIVTRLDMVHRIGGVLAAADAGRLAFIAGSVTPHFAYGLRRLTPEILARRLFAGALEDDRRLAG